ncbi:copper resistance protein CopC [Nitrosomonas communis]|uniref:copper resistance CopC family protein n=1 Tax=Nitrosomonas communis TaxID=44574 RepID=UPI0026F0FD50|nr:copper resistance protein CopC [Nitrosomonas communis]MCO6428477.1 copper resistance protein CopC [Nitrosomonas communis]
MKIKWTVSILKQVVTLSIIVTVMTLMYANQAFAHAALVKAEPARRAVLSAAPAQVRLWFNEEIEPAYASLSVLDNDKKPVTDNKVKVHPEDLKSIFLELPEMKAGRYTVKFRVLSVDGHVVDSDYNFTVADKVKKDD